MSEDLIKRSDAIKAIEEHCFFINNQCTYPSEGCIEVIEDAINVPPADRPQGEWIDKGWRGDWQYETDGRGHCWKVFECSVCNGWNTRKSRFCPNCGARMKGADDD